MDTQTCAQLEPKNKAFQDLLRQLGAQIQQKVGGYEGFLQRNISLLLFVIWKWSLIVFIHRQHSSPPQTHEFNRCSNSFWTAQHRFQTDIRWARLPLNVLWLLTCTLWCSLLIFAFLIRLLRIWCFFHGRTQVQSRSSGMMASNSSRSFLSLNRRNWSFLLSELWLACVPDTSQGWMTSHYNQVW